MNQPHQRDTGIDVLKGILVIGMIATHVIELLGDQQFRSLVTFQRFGELIAYPGFLFSFGYAAQIAYFSAGYVNFRRIFPTVYRPILAFYISGICYLLIVQTHYVTLGDAFRVLIFWRIPYFSEFLVGFSLTLLVAALLQKPLIWITANYRRMLVCCVVLLCTTLFPYNLIQIPEIALLVGSPSRLITAFPVLQYFIFFLVGMYFARHNIQLSRPFAVSAVAGAIAAILIFRFLPFNRFPPSLTWIAASIPLVLVWYMIARIIDVNLLARRVLAFIGANSLFYLLMSNIILFGLTVGITHNANHLTVLLLTATIIGAIYFCTTIVRQVKYS